MSHDLWVDLVGRKCRILKDCKAVPFGGGTPAQITKDCCGTVEELRVTSGQKELKVSITSGDAHWGQTWIFRASDVMVEHPHDGYQISVTTGKPGYYKVGTMGFLLYHDTANPDTAWVQLDSDEDQRQMPKSHIRVYIHKDDNFPFRAEHSYRQPNGDLVSDNQGPLLQRGEEGRIMNHYWKDANWVQVWIPSRKRISRVPKNHIEVGPRKVGDFVVKSDDKGAVGAGTNMNSPGFSPIGFTPQQGNLKITIPHLMDQYRCAPFTVSLQDLVNGRHLGSIGPKGNQFHFQTSLAVGPPVGTIIHPVFEIMHNNVPHIYEYARLPLLADLSDWQTARSLGIGYTYQDKDGNWQKFYHQASSQGLERHPLQPLNSYATAMGIIHSLRREQVVDPHHWERDFGIEPTTELVFEHFTQTLNINDLSSYSVKHVHRATFRTGADRQRDLEAIGIRNFGAVYKSFPEGRTPHFRTGCDRCFIESWTIQKQTGHGTGGPQGCFHQPNIAGGQSCQWCIETGRLECSWTNMTDDQTRTKFADYVFMRPRVDINKIVYAINTPTLMDKMVRTPSTNKQD